MALLRDFATRTRAPCAAVGPTRRPLTEPDAYGRSASTVRTWLRGRIATCRRVSFRYPYGASRNVPKGTRSEIPVVAPRHADIPAPAHCLAPSGRRPGQRLQGRQWRGAERNSPDGNADTGEKFLIPIHLVGAMKRPVCDRSTIIRKCGRARLCVAIGITKELFSIDLYRLFSSAFVYSS